MDKINDFYDVFIRSTQGATENILEFIPNFLGALVIFFIGLIVAKLIKGLSNKLFKAIGVNKISKKAGIDDFLYSAGYHKGLSVIFSKVIFWGIFLLFLIPVSDILGLRFFADIINQTITYLPNIIFALLIVSLGAWAAKVLSGMVRGSAVRLGEEYAGILGTVTSIIVLIVTFVIALSQLNIEAAILTYMLLMVIGAISLGVGLAFGLGAKNIIGNIVAGVYLSKALKQGSEVKTKKFDGKIVDIGSVTCKIETNDGKQVSINNCSVLETI